MVTEVVNLGYWSGTHSSYHIDSSARLIHSQVFWSGLLYKWCTANCEAISSDKTGVNESCTAGSRWMSPSYKECIWWSFFD